MDCFDSKFYNNGKAAQWNTESHSEHIFVLKVFSSENAFLHQNCINLALHHLLTSGSSAVNGCRQNDSPNS